MRVRIPPAQPAPVMIDAFRRWYERNFANPKTTSMPVSKQRLLRLYQRLGERERASLLDFAEYLASRGGGGEAQTPIAEPNPMPRPEEESLIAAIRRLRAGYPMLNSEALLNDVSALMAQHTMQGRPADEVIDELEALFDSHYRKQIDP